MLLEKCNGRNFERIEHLHCFQDVPPNRPYAIITILVFRCRRVFVNTLSNILRFAFSTVRAVENDPSRKIA